MPIAFPPQTFCGFLSLRFGVLALSAIATIGSAIVTITGWAQVMQLAQHPIPLNDEAALFFHSLLFTVLAALGIFGVICGVLRKPFLVLPYLILLAIHLLLSFCAGSFVLSIIFRGNPPDVVDRCRRGAKDELTTLVCTNGIAIQKSVAVIVYLVSWILEAYTCTLVYGFYRYLSWKPNTNAIDPENAAAKPDIMVFPPTPTKSTHKHGASGSVDIRSISSPVFHTEGAAGMNHGYAFSTIDHPEWGNAVGRPIRSPQAF
ncbi:hypothetical protein Moror_3026 [Moniliophthora roreri MCA 2997]|uniref:Uncharacterized protein n=2 Tax=Moniliophthora roreri TaxID=221103 RepID=V2X4G9_MONRO|nr:hypothetical protein Moror_3026 [Moniliophthora roreri MCA 2997]KAI3616370.1 hypothetical protein WG66_012594 [Moniliophthora roreri]